MAEEEATQEKPEEVKLEGGPDTTPMPEPKEDPTPEAEPEQTPAAKTPIYSSPGGEFSTPEELAAYTKGLEKALANQAKEELEKKNDNPIFGESETKTKADSDTSMGDLVLTDTGEFVKRLKKELRDESDQERALDAANRDFWSGFYEENADLRNKKSLVNFIMSEHKAEWKALNLLEGKTALLKKVRGFISEAAGDAGTKVTQLSSATPTVLGSSNTPLPMPEKKAAKPLNFLEQIKLMQSKKFGNQ